MASSAWSASRFAIAAALRAIAAGGLALAAVDVAVQAHYYATALILLGLALIVTVDLARTVRAADRLYADFVGSLAAGAADRPPGSARRFPVLAAALGQAADRLSRDRYDQARRVQELEALIDTVSAALLVVRGDGQLLLANRAARALAGQPAARLADIPAIGPAAAARLAHLAPGAREIVRLADERRMLASAAVFSGPGGEPRRLISLQGLSSELSAVETKAWRDLVRILAHEMMNSLTPIASLSQSLQELMRDPEGQAALAAEAASAMDVIARRSAGLMSFVERYRRVAELPEPRPEPLPAAALIGSLRRLTAGLFESHGAALDCRVQPDDLTLHADSDLLEQALINLLKNAAEAVAGAAWPRVELSCRAEDQQVLIEIADNGAGLPQSDPEMIFTPFFTTKAGGSGVGLTLARQIAVAHGGELSVRRNEAGGATFTLALPVRG
jgi:nitrogen fixation/metabolism regulation signal transduction histidine kinase